MKKFRLSILLSVLSCLFATTSFMVNWPFQMIVSGLVYLVSSCWISQKMENTRNKISGLLILIVPFILLYAIGSVVKQAYITYPIWIIAIVNVILGYLVARIKVRALRNFALTILCAAIIPFCYYGMLNWISYIRNSAAIVNIPAKSFQFHDLDGNKLALEQFKGKTILLDFWSSTCAPCIKRFPEIQRLHDHYKGDSTVVIASINLPVDRDKNLSMATFGNLNKYDFRKYFCYSDSMIVHLRIEYLPTIMIIDKSFRLRYKGSFRSENFYFFGNPKNLFKKLVNEKVE